MASSEKYSVGELFDFRAEDLRGLMYETIRLHLMILLIAFLFDSYLKVKGWSDLPAEKREECLEKLR